MAIVILAGTALLGALAFAVFTVLVVSIQRTPQGLLSESNGKRPGVIARRVLTGFGTESKEDIK